MYKKTAGRGKVTARVASVRAALSGATTNDVDQTDRPDVLEGCYRVLGDAMDSTWMAWERFDQERGHKPIETAGARLPFLD